jgi:hypothetical protein
MQNALLFVLGEAALWSAPARAAALRTSQRKRRLNATALQSGFDAP